MGCRQEWADESQLIMHLHLEFPWTWEDFDNAAKEVYLPLRNDPRPVAMVINVSKMGRIPAGNVMAHLKEVERIMPESVFASVLVGAPYAATVFMNVLMKIRPDAKRSTVFANSMEEAHRIIHERYRELYP